MSRVKVSSKLQVAVPAEARKKLRIEPGDYLLVEVQDNSIVLTPEPKDYVAQMLGFHAEIWEGIDTDEYLRQERASWTK